jgi:hypothetical protein
MIKHKLIDNILHIDFIGDITFDELVELSKNFSEHRIKGDFLLLIYDLREANMNFSIRDYSRISDLAQNSTQGYRFVKAAFVVTSPRITAMLSIFSQLTWSNHTQRKVFSTPDAAMAWLHLFNQQQH